MAIQTADTSNFADKIKTLQKGDTLILAKGNYGLLSIFNKDFDGVTISGGHFTGVILYQVKGLKLDSPQIDFVPNGTSTSNSQAVRIVGSSNIVISDAVVKGGVSSNGVLRSATELDSSGNVLGLPVGKGINIDRSDGIIIRNSDISSFHKGITFSNSSNLTIANNTIHDLRTTPISGSVDAGLKITGNHTFDSNPWNFGRDGDHGDRIHIWTKNTAITGLVISDNLLEQGKGAPMLGIYLDDNGLGLGFRNAVISGNRLTDGHVSGLLLENVTGTVSDNTLTWSGFGSVTKNAPRFVLDDNSRDLAFSRNSGDVVINAGVRNVSFKGQRGEIDQATDMSATDRASIVFDNQIITGFGSATLKPGMLN